MRKCDSFVRLPLEETQEYACYYVCTLNKIK